MSAASLFEEQNQKHVDTQPQQRPTVVLTLHNTDVRYTS